MNLAVVSCFYHFAPFERPVANMHRFIRRMEEFGVPVFGVEAFIPGKPKHTADYANWTQIEVCPETQVLWQKEALLNLAEKLVPEEYDAVAWIDADVDFDNPSWVKDTEKLLETKDVVQLFDQAVWLDRQGKPEMKRFSISKVSLSPTWKSHPGFALSMRRDVWRRAGGLYPYALSGGGDSVMGVAFNKNRLWQALTKHLGTNPQPYEEWRKRLGSVRLGHTPGRCIHAWHGTRKDRDYVGRAERVSKLHIGKDYELTDNGLLAWTDQADPLTVKAVADYFLARNEDG